MKCPKCGYNSFESYDSCKKCGNDLTGFKITYGLRSIVLPFEARRALAGPPADETGAGDALSEMAMQQGDMFSFDLPDTSPLDSGADDPFNFGDDPLPSSPAAGAFSFDVPAAAPQAEEPREESFADLLESTAHKEEPAVTAGTGQQSPDLGSFSWDDASPAPAENAAPSVDNDFDSIFSDFDDPGKR